MGTLYTNNEKNSNYWGKNVYFIQKTMRRKIITWGKNRTGGKQKFPEGKRAVREQLADMQLYIYWRKRRIVGKSVFFPLLLKLQRQQ